MHAKEWLGKNGMNIIRRNPEERQEGYFYHSEVIQAMEEYAKSCTIKFTKWIIQSDWQFSRDEENSFDKRAGRLIHGRVLETKTTEELYKLFKEEQLKKK